MKRLNKGRNGGHNRRARLPARRRWQQGLASSRRPVMSGAKQTLIRERQEGKYVEELALKHDLQQQEGRYVKAPRYLQAASKKHVDRRYREDAIEMTVEMVISENARYTQIEDQFTGRLTISYLNRWAKIMWRRSKIRIRALKREPCNRPVVWFGSKLRKPGTSIPTT